MALGWQVYDLTHDPLDLGLLGLVQFGPMLLLSLPAGHIADRRDQRIVMASCIAVFAALSLVLSVASAAGRPNAVLIYLLVACLGAARAFEGPAGSVVLMGLVPRASVSRALASDSSIRQTAMIAGPGVGGLLYGASPIVAYAVCGAIYIAALVLVMVVPRMAVRRGVEATSLRSIFAGIHFIRSDKAVQGAMWLDLLALLLASTTAVLPVFARDILKSGPLALGLLRAASALGAVATALVLSRYPLRRHGGPLMFAAVAIYAVAICVFAVSGGLILSVCALVLMGASDQLSVFIRNTLVQLRTPDPVRGRVSAVSNVFIMTSVQLGDFRAGAAAAWLGPVQSVLIGGLSALLLTAFCRLLFPALSQIDRLNDHETGPVVVQSG